MVAALASGSGSILESLGVRRAGAYGGMLLDLVALRRQWVTFVGLSVDVLGSSSPLPHCIGWRCF
ncbi:MAG TPA: hypothetical protein VFV67_36590 [Actinophytocola sp.]|nr:hypothetical protein [Actinophytocola sp.]